MRYGTVICRVSEFDRLFGADIKLLNKWGVYTVLYNDEGNLHQINCDIKPKYFKTLTEAKAYSNKIKQHGNV